MRYFCLLLCSACSLYDGPVYFESGTYVLFDPTSSGLTAEHGEEYIPEFESFSLVIDLENLKAQINGTTFDTEFTLQERPKNEYETHCPMQLSATWVQTFDINEELSLWGSTLKNAFIAADDCDEDIPAINLLLSTADHDISYYLTKQ